MMSGKTENKKVGSRLKKPELQIIGVQFVSVPDSERRLARVFDLLLNKAPRDGPEASEADDNCAGRGNMPEPPVRENHVQ